MHTPTRAEAGELSFRAAFGATYADVQRYAGRRVAPPDVPDVVAETYLAAWRRWADCPAPDRPLPWLYAIAGNVIRNHGRGQRRRQRLVERLTHRRVGVLPAPELPDPELHAALARLSADDQELLRLIAWEQLSHAEIAGILGCSPNAVAIRAHRARKRLAGFLGDERHRPGGGRHDDPTPPKRPDHGGTHGG